MKGKRTYLKSICICMLMAFLWLYASDAWAQILPDIPDIIRVSVDHSDDGVWIEWEPSEDNDIARYHLYKQVGESFQMLFSFNATTFAYKHMTSGLVDLAYAVQAEDSLGNRSVIADNVHKAVDVNAEFDLCTQSNIVSWTPYLGWEGEISGYRIFGGRSGDPMQELEFVSSSTNSYTHSGVQANTAYTYYIETVNLRDLYALSSIDSAYTTYPEAPTYLILDHVSVLDEATVEVQFSADIAGPVKSFRLLRRSNSGTPFLEVDTYWNVMNPTQIVQDQVATSSVSYQYKIESVFQPAGCAAFLVISESNHGNNVLLTNTVNDQMITLNWTPYETYEPGLAAYLIQRRSQGGDFADLATVGPLSTQWQEPIQSLVNGFQPGEVQYRVIAISNPHSGGTEEQSISNITTVVVETDMQVPNAFTPGSNDINSEFRPIMDFAPREYLMMVMDRGGRKMFETTDPEEGWDGRFQGGSLVDEAVYVYYIQYTDYTGLFRTFTGNVTVLYL